MHVAIIGGASTIGATVAYAIGTYRDDVDVTLIDIDEEAARGHATDLTHARYHLANGPTQGTGAGTFSSRHPDDIGGLDPDIAVIAADKPRDVDGTLERGFRDERIDRIEDMLADIVRQLDRLGPRPVINATNPLDRALYYVWDHLGWDRSYFIGYSLSETARVADGIARIRDVHPNRIACPTMGEHGAHVVPIFSRATLDGEPLDLHDEEKRDVRSFVRDVPIRIANQRGLAESSRWVTSAGILRIIAGIDAGGTPRPLCLSVPLDGEYGFETGCLSIPVMLDEDGVAETIEWELTPPERAQLETAYEAIRSTLPDPAD